MKMQKKGLTKMTKRGVKKGTIRGPYKKETKKQWGSRFSRWFLKELDKISIETGKGKADIIEEKFK